LRLLQQQHEGLAASPTKGRAERNPHFDSTLHSEQSLNAQYILRMEAETSAKKLKATDELFAQNEQIEREKAEAVNSRYRQYGMTKDASADNLNKYVEERLQG